MDDWQKISLLHKDMWYASDNLTYKNIIELTFNECFNVLKEANIIFLTQVKKGCYRFIILDRDRLYFLLLRLIKIGYIIEVFRLKDKKNIFSKYSSSRKLKKYLAEFKLIRIYKIYKNRSGVVEFSSEVSFELEYWYKKNSYYVTDSKNGIQNRLSQYNLEITRQVQIFNHKVKQINELYIRDKFLEKDTVKNIDIVYTWVDGSDKKWLQKKEKYQNFDNKELHSSSVSLNRFENRDELKYALRSIEKFFLGYRRVFIVVDDQKPTWLKESKELIVIDHKDIFPNQDILPVFNSHAIETVLHRIRGLSEHYLYINDDIFFGRAVDVSLFFPKKGHISIFPSTSTYIPFSKANNELLPVDTAAINTRNLLFQKDICFAEYKFKHTALPQLKSILFELENIFFDEVYATRASRFRNPKDISMTSSLLYNYLYCKNITTQTPIEYAYISLGVKNRSFILKKLTRSRSEKRPEVFCVNDVEGDILKSSTQNFVLTMENFLPNLSRYEKNKR